MKRINSLSDLLMEELADLLDAENQLVEGLPKMAETSQSSALRRALEDYLKVTERQGRRLEDIFSNIGQNPQRVKCKAMESLIMESEDVIDKKDKSQDHDGAIISVLQRMEQYQISSYQTACEHAVDLGHTRIVELLNETINEERAMHLHLNELAQGMINAQAIEPGLKSESGGFYIPEGKFGRGGIKKKNKNTDVSRYISEGNPNIQDSDPQGQGGVSN